MQAASRVNLVHETTGNTDFTDESNSCGSSVAGVILQDRDTPVNLEQVSKFNSTNQNMYSNAGNYHGVFLDRESFWQICLFKTPMSTRIFWQLLKKPIGSTFWRRKALHLWDFMTIRIDTRVTYNVRS